MMILRLLTLGVFLLPLVDVAAAEWKLVWSDEFEYKGLPDPKKWSYEEGFERNQELQYYTKERLDNARVEDGHLIIEGKKESFKNERFVAGSQKWNEQQEFAAYTSASLITRHTASWTYGRMEVRAKLPQGKGVWPAIWTLGTKRTQVGWPKCGEIDIMEFVGKSPDLIHANAHYGLNGKHSSSGGKIQTQEPFANFHVYAINWTKDQIEFFFDDNLYYTFDLAKADQGAVNPFREPHYLILNLALGGTWGGKMDDAVLPQKFVIDYVRIYEAQAAGE